ncbi:hypothetical protein ACN2XU_04515 [Primorskyibacter sp. 2E107]|uniref:hypothetical protein n=1 Tax=Primorskyibacter sp. 2E107 TaxID=3403458 RepID=UPI003AF89314
MKGDALDPKGLITEAYRIEGITVSECRSIFLDWALSVPVDVDTGALIGTLLARFEPEAPEHPMTGVLREGLDKMTTPRRRGGYRARDRG